MRGLVFIRTRARARAATVAVAVTAVLLGAFLTGCAGTRTSQEPRDGIAAESPSASAAVAGGTADDAEPSNDAVGGAGPGTGSADAAGAAGNRPEAVRDAFAGLQATLNGTCVPGSSGCAYFLGRVNDELACLDKAMKADSKGPGHFKEPLAWIDALRGTLKGDASTENLEKRRSELLGTRDRINTWMQGHPEDYR
ncbi:hypothetical protein ACFW5D_08785 [Streptomyces sp. NPDC058770]|uniref:hypothetical protein n=1 Tax=Streptomyces sp. NPDC058770 TaxID=3346631 RepID=UPI0036B7E634